MNRADQINLQREYCIATKQPFTMPETGYCLHCGFDLLSHKEIVFALHREAINGCPACLKAFDEMPVGLKF